MGKYSQYCEDTCFLFASPTFLYGFASAIDLGGTLIEYNASKSPQEADMRAIATDWAVTGKNIQSAIKALVKE